MREGQQRWKMAPLGRKQPQQNEPPQKRKTDRPENRPDDRRGSPFLACLPDKREVLSGIAVAEDDNQQQEEEQQTGIDTFSTEESTF